MKPCVAMLNGFPEETCELGVYMAFWDGLKGFELEMREESPEGLKDANCELGVKTGKLSA